MRTSLKARERRFHHGYVCPRCQSAQVQRWGRERTGTQRYRCFGGRRTFNDLTRTAMAGTHLPAKWRAYADSTRDGLSTRKAGARIDVDHKTAWRWRHKVMACFAPVEQPALSGIVEADETYFRRNFKGSTPIGRRARKHGTRNGSTRGLGKDKVPVVVARARVGDTRAMVLPGTSITAALVTALGPVLAPGVTLCTDGSRAMRGAAPALPVRHIALVTARNERKRGIYHIQTVNSYRRLSQGVDRPVPGRRDQVPAALPDLAHHGRADSAVDRRQGPGGAGGEHRRTQSRPVLPQLRGDAQCGINGGFDAARLSSGRVLRAATSSVDALVARGRRAALRGP